MVMFVVDGRYLVDRVSPGTRITVLGVVSLFSSMATKVSSPFIRTPYLRVLGEYLPLLLFCFETNV